MEKVYKTMQGIGIISITLGIISLVVGITAGVLTIISGIRLLKNKNEIIF